MDLSGFVSRSYDSEEDKNLSNKTLSKFTEKRLKKKDNVIVRPKVKLPTPEAFYLKQRTYKKQERKNIRERKMIFMKKETVKHNLNLRTQQLRQESKEKENLSIVELEVEEEVEELKEENKISESVLSFATLEDLQVDLLVNMAESVISVASSEPHGFYLNDMEEALQENNKEKLNQNRIKEVQKMLSENKGNEYKLFEQVSKQYQNDKTKKRHDSLKTTVMNIKNKLQKNKKEKTAVDFGGRFVLGIIEKGGQWWVNKQPLKQHPSQRRRVTLLNPDLNGKLTSLFR
eukprot:snap_masked-scaffold_21-processed-gene-0.11-mRNA-1 protein AED:1.00 eAED:1.00 QI:0/0/0/0/1/1/2/0/287